MNFYNLNLKFVLLNALGVPLGSLIFCYLYTMVSNFEQANWYKCGAKNIFPSISTVIAFDQLTYSVWLITMIYQTPFQILLAKNINSIYKKILLKKLTCFYLTIISEKKYRNFVVLRKCLYLVYFINNIQILGILIASVFKSSYNFGISLILFLFEINYFCLSNTHNWLWNLCVWIYFVFYIFSFF